MTTPDEVVEGDDVTITCALSKFDAENQGKRITFVKLNGNQEARVEESKNILCYMKIMRFKDTVLVHSLIC